MENYAKLMSKDMAELASNLERRTVADSRVILSARVLKNVQAVSFWMCEQVCKGKPLDVADFTVVELEKTKELMRIQEEGKTETPSIKPDKFDPNKWTTWSKQFVTFLLHNTGHQYAPLDYMLQQEPHQSNGRNVGA